MKTQVLVAAGFLIYSSGFSQNVGIGLTVPTAKLSISANGIELAGSAASNLLRTNAGILGNLAGDELSLANFGFASGNNSSLGITAYRRLAGADWMSTSLLIGYDVDNTARAGGGFLTIGANGNIGISTSTPSFALSFPPVLGDKISLWSNSSNSYGFGIQGSQLQIHTDISAADIVFGYGSSAAFNETMRVKGNGNVGIGTTTPNAKLVVNGNLKVVDGTQGSGKILTSDATGLASWQLPPNTPNLNYTVVWICCNPWMTKNLDVSTYRNGDPIPKVTGSAEWIALTTGAYCYYNNDSATYAATYGKLYNWYAVNDPRGLAPVGWHIPTDFEWTTLSTCLGGDGIAGGLMKEIGISHWTTPNLGATNLSGFKSLPGGLRWYNDGTFAGIGLYNGLWSFSEYNGEAAWERDLNNNSVGIFRNTLGKNFGLSVRCVRD